MYTTTVSFYSTEYSFGASQASSLVNQPAPSKVEQTMLSPSFEAHFLIRASNSFRFHCTSHCVSSHTFGHPA